MKNTYENLIYMANQIARTFEATVNVDPVTATADHIATFWDPRMKAALIAGDPHLRPTAQAAFHLLRSRGAPAATFGAHQLGDGSDAG